MLDPLLERKYRSEAFQMPDPEFTAHNIRLDDGSFTRTESEPTIDLNPWCRAAVRMLDMVFPGERSHLRVADLGCLEGGYAVEFARRGFQVVGIEARETNIAACRHVQSRTHLPNLSFVHDDVWNLSAYGTFDAVFCCGLLYHLDRPAAFLRLLGSLTTTLLIVNTHFATAEDPPREENHDTPSRFALSGLVEHESLMGRWYEEYVRDEDRATRESERWSSWENRRSFWLQREYLLQAIHQAGFDLVMEQYDVIAPWIAHEILQGYYKNASRGTFVGIKTRS